MRPSATAVPTNAVRQALPPVLHQALTNLDMQIEEELARYRRQRHQRTGTPRPTASLTAPKTTPKTLDLIAIPALGGRTQPWSAATGASQADETVNVGAGRSQPEQSAWDSTRTALGTAAVLGSGTDLGSDLGSAVVVNRAVESELEGHRTHSLAQSRLDQDVDSTLGSDIARIDAAMIERDRSGEPLSVTASNVPTAADGHLEDYLESSEALLQSLAEEEAQVRAETGFMKSLITPVGVGSMLLLLLSSSLLGYVLMNPGSFGQLLSMNLGNPPNTAPISSVASSTTDEAPLSPLEPNLAAQEFKDLNLNTLGTLKLNGGASSSSNLPSPGLKPTGSNPAVKAGGTPTQPIPGSGSKPRIALSDNASRQSTGVVGPSIVLSQRGAPTYGPTSPIPTYRPPQPQPRSQPPAYRPPAQTRSSGQSGNRPQTVPQTAPPPAAPVASPSSSPVASPTASSPATRRTVVVPFTHDRDLDAAQRIEPNARMDSSFDDGITRINVGSYTDESAARERVEQFQKQGVNAQIREEVDAIK